MLWALEIVHVGRMNESLRRRRIPTADWPTPLRPIVVPIRHKNVWLARHISIDHGADIAHRDGEDALPARANGARICPLILQGIFDACDRYITVVVIAGGVVGPHGRDDEILDCDSSVWPLIELVSSGWNIHPTPLMRGQ